MNHRKLVTKCKVEKEGRCRHEALAESQEKSGKGLASRASGRIRRKGLQRLILGQPAKIKVKEVANWFFGSTVTSTVGLEIRQVKVTSTHGISVATIYAQGTAAVSILDCYATVVSKAAATAI